jgi:hypothetical protein
VNIWHLVQAISILFVALAGISLFGGKPQEVGLVLGLGGPPEATLPPIEKAISPQRVINLVKNLTDLNDRSLGNTPEEKASDDLRQTFSSLGLDTQELPVVLDRLQIENVTGHTIMNVPSENMGLGGVAFHSKELQPGQVLTGPLLFLPSGIEYPSSATLTNKIVLIEEAKDKPNGDGLRQFIAHYNGQVSCLAAISFSMLGEREKMVTLLSQSGLRVHLAVSEDIVASIAGKLHPEQEVWLVAHYDTRPGSPGADLGVTGPAALVELANLLKNQSYPYTVRFILLDGTFTGLEGAVDFLQMEELHQPKVLAVLELDELGDWEKIAMSVDLSGKDTDPQNVEKLKEDGQAYLQELWIRRLDLDKPELLKWIDSETTQGGGLSETPLFLRTIAQQAASELGITLTPFVFSPCTQTGHTFLAKGFPTLILCGQGNGLAGTSYDTPQNLDSQKLRKAIALAYSIIDRIQNFH